MTRARFQLEAQGADAAWNYLTGQLFRHRNAELERIKEAVLAASVPMPADIVQALAQLNPDDLREALRSHPGFALWEANRSYETSYGVFERAFADLFKKVTYRPRPRKSACEPCSATIASAP